VSEQTTFDKMEQAAKNRQAILDAVAKEPAEVVPVLEMPTAPAPTSPDPRCCRTAVLRSPREVPGGTGGLVGA
jgi:hypothetical protein